MIRFGNIQEKHLKMIMDWRVQPEVTQFMLTDVEYNMNNQRRWFEKISKDDSSRYWMIYYKDLPIGIINLADIDRTHLHCTAGYYIGELEYRQLGAMITPYLYNYVFKELKLRKIYGEVIFGNESIMKIHKMHGFREVGTYRDHVCKNGTFYDVILIELLSEHWLKQKKFARYVADFE